MKILLVFAIFGVFQLTNTQTSHTYSIARKDIMPIVEKLAKIAKCNNTDTTTNVWTFNIRGPASCKLPTLLHNVTAIDFKDTSMEKPGYTYILGSEQVKSKVVENKTGEHLQNANKTEQERLMREKKDRANYIAIVIVAVFVSILIAFILGLALFEYIKTKRQSDSYVVQNPGCLYDEEETSCSHTSPGFKRR